MINKNGGRKKDLPESDSGVMETNGLRDQPDKQIQSLIKEYFMSQG